MDMRRKGTQVKCTGNAQGRHEKTHKEALEEPSGLFWMNLKYTRVEHVRGCADCWVSTQFSQGWTSAQGLFVSWEYEGTQEERKGNAKGTQQEYIREYRDRTGKPDNKS